jgi:hypothetical protein
MRILWARVAGLSRVDESSRRGMPSRESLIQF